MESILNRILYKFRREKLDSSWKNRNQIIIVVRILDLSKRKKTFSISWQVHKTYVSDGLNLWWVG